MQVVLLVQLATTLAMTGLIWFVQAVHYPLFASVGTADFTAYQAGHVRRTQWIVGPLMLAEFVTALLFLLPRFRPASVAAAVAWWGLALLGLIWVTTARVQVPLHTRLGAGYDRASAARLVTTNWVRTLAWTARSVLLLAATARAIR